MFLSSFFFLLSSNSFNFASLLCIIVSYITLYRRATGSENAAHT